MDFKLQIAAEIAAVTKSDTDEIANAIEVPPDAQMGDYAFPCYKLAKQYKKAPSAIAIEISSKIKAPDFIDKTAVSGAYLNFFVNRGYFAKAVLSEIFDKGSNFGSADVGQGGCVVIDYSSPNIAKPFHVGNFRSTVIGHALYNIFNFLGYRSFSINYLGDFGTQFGKVITAYEHWGVEEDVKNGGISALNELYVKFHEEAEKNPALENEARGWHKKMEQGDAHALKLWKWFVDISMVEYNRVYDRLGINFDSYNGESFYNDKMAPVVKELHEKGLLTESDGAMIVNLDEYKMPPALILRSDGGTLYTTRDIASVKYRMENYDFVKALYVTGSEQILHFAQWFKVVELMGYDWAAYRLVHVPFGLVRFADGKFSTRKGRVVKMEDLLDEAIAKIDEIIEQKNPNLSNKELVAEQVGIGAVLFNDLYNSRIKDVEFDWGRMLNFEGETGPYVQYTHARCVSVLKKSSADYTNCDLSLLTNNDEFELIKLLYTFPEKVIEAADKYEPFVISRFVMQLAQVYNKFYHSNPILRSEEDLKKARLFLTNCTKNVINTALGLLGIKSPNEM